MEPFFFTLFWIAGIIIYGVIHVEASGWECALWPYMLLRKVFHKVCNWIKKVFGYV